MMQTELQIKPISRTVKSTKPLAGRSIVSIHDVNRTEIELILRQAECYEQLLTNGERLQTLQGRVLATLFFEPSTRTRLSFESAMYRLGGAVISTADGHHSSSAVKGETIADTIRTVTGYADVIAHMLATNGYPDGQQELPGTPAVLDKIMIDAKK